MEIDQILQLTALAWQSGDDQWHGQGATLTRIRRGMNNALYRVEHGKDVYACKLCVQDDRRRAWREVSAMRLLADAGLDLAPSLLGWAESAKLAPYPAVVYHWLPGQPPGPNLNEKQLAEVLASFHSLHGLHPKDFPDSGMLDARFHWFDFSPYLDELHGFLGSYGPWLRGLRPDGSRQYGRLLRLVLFCQKTLLDSQVPLGRQEAPRSLCRVDPNLDNLIAGPDGRLRWVDWEFSGWGDPALDLADFRWHASWEELPADGHSWLREHYKPPPGDASFYQRLALWDRLLVTRWPFLVLRLLWSLDNGPDRQRLTLPAEDFQTIYKRLLRFIERAEKLGG